MSSSDKRSQYSIAKLLHWLVALIVLLMLMTGWRTGDFDLDDKELIIMIHSGLGTAVFILMLYRWWWRRSNNLYSPPGWWRRPSKLIPWLFYPTLLLHPLFGLMQAVFIDYKVVAFGFVNYSMLAVNDISLADTFHGLHELTAVLLILIFLFHVVEKSRKFFVDDSNSMKTEP